MHLIFLNRDAQYILNRKFARALLRRVAA
jgi:hypothetical protein